VSEPSPESQPRAPVAQGPHDLNSFVTAFLALHLRRYTGVFETGNRRGWRRLYFLAGEVVGFHSSFAQDTVSRSLVASGVVPKARIQWFEERLEPGEPLEAALLAAGVVSPAQLAEHEASRIRQGILATLRAGAGTWSFTPCPGLSPGHVAAELLPHVVAVRELWEGVRQHVPVDNVAPGVSDGARGPVVAGPELRALLAELELEPPLAFLAEAVEEAVTVEELFRQIPDRSGNLLKLVWMLERGGLLLRPACEPRQDLIEDLARVWAEASVSEVEARRLAVARAAWRAPDHPAPKEPGEPTHASTLLSDTPGGTAKPAPEEHSEPPTAVPEDDPPDSAGRAQRVPRDSGSSTAYVRSVLCAAASEPLDPAQIAGEHAKRMDRDFYGFLGLKPGCPRPVVERRCEHMARRWESVDDAALDATARRQRRQLLQGLQIVWQTLCVPERKEEYDRRVREGRASRVEVIRRALEQPEPPRAVDPPPAPEEPTAEHAELQQAQRLMARGNWAAAAQILERMRRQEPSSPDVLAELGWATWKATGRAGGGEDDPESFVALALTFAPRHTRALEYFARLAWERGEHEALQTRLDRLLAVDRGNAWALEMLATDAVPPPSGKKSSGGGLRFWRRRTDG